MNRHTTIAAAFAALTLIAGPAAAGQPKEDAMSVKIGGLDVSSPQGAQVTLRRIRAAAQEFCGEGWGRDLGQAAKQRQCVREMTSKAVAKLNSPMVTALYTGNHSIQLASAGTQSR